MDYIMRMPIHVDKNELHAPAEAVVAITRIVSKYMHAVGEEPGADIISFFTEHMDEEEFDW